MGSDIPEQIICFSSKRSNSLRSAAVAAQFGQEWQRLTARLAESNLLLRSLNCMRRMRTPFFGSFSDKE